MRRGILLLALAACVGLGVGMVARSSGLSPVRITSGSMSPAIDVGRWVVVRDDGVGGRGNVQAGDVVLFRFPLGTEGRAVKRVVAVAGDTVAFTDRSVTVNGHTAPIAGSPAESGEARRGRVTVAPGHVFLLGDNAAASIDSRSFGTVPEGELIGLVRYVLPRPPSAAFASVALLLVGMALAAAWHRRRIQ